MNFGVQIHAIRMINDAGGKGGSLGLHFGSGPWKRERVIGTRDIRVVRQINFRGLWRRAGCHLDFIRLGRGDIVREIFRSQGDQIVGGRLRGRNPDRRGSALFCAGRRGIDSSWSDAVPTRSSSSSMSVC